MIGNLIAALSLICVILCSWNLVQQNMIGGEPFAKIIGLTYGVMSLGAVAWLFAPFLPFGDIGVPLLLAGLAFNLVAVSLRLARLYENS